jgi:hypothetical protein
LGLVRVRGRWADGPAFGQIRLCRVAMFRRMVKFIFSDFTANAFN